MWRPFRARAHQNERTLSQLSGRGAFIETETSVVLLSGGGGGSSRKEGGCWNDEDEEEGVNGSGVRVEAAGGLFWLELFLASLTRSLHACRNVSRSKKASIVSATAMASFESPLPTISFILCDNYKSCTLNILRVFLLDQY